MNKKKKCYFIANGITHVDYRDTHLLEKFTNTHGKLLTRKKTGLCAQYHRKVACAIKRARYMALMSYISR